MTDRTAKKSRSAATIETSISRAFKRTHQQAEDDHPTLLVTPPTESTSNETIVNNDRRSTNNNELTSWKNVKIFGLKHLTHCNQMDSIRA